MAGIDADVIESAGRALLLVPVLPLIGSILAFLLASRGNSRHALGGWLATGFAASAFILAVRLYLRLPDFASGMIEAEYWRWFFAGDLNVNLGLRFDRLSAVMTLVVTGVGSLIHLYAIGYMEHDESRPRFFAYMNLFLFFMLLLVLGSNLLVMFVGWEGVGLCSYLLIGFWFREMENANAGQKAFVVNRIGDAGFILGIFILIIGIGSLDFIELQQSVHELSPALISIAAALLFIGAIGKSAQIPLFVWLPDAMAGPTPVSALIHAATMVTAGVYMVTRMSFLYVLAPNVLLGITIIGTLTAFLAATVALTQNDIKKVLAYSTVSQLGYMFMALGSAAFSNGIFHVVTHAFFKACLFMAAGSVIMGCHHEQDMRQFGGLWKKMPATFFAYFAATLAIAGFPFTSGFYSKDAILWTVYSAPGDPGQMLLPGGIMLRELFWTFGILTAFLTAFYMTRSLVMTFFGEYRGSHHPHESPLVVTIPISILAIFSLGFAAYLGDGFLEYLLAWTRGDMTIGHEALLHNPQYHLLEQLSIVVALSGIGLAVLFYGFMPHLPGLFARTFSRTHRFLSNKWWLDELYEVMIIRPLFDTAKLTFSLIDRFLIDGLVNGAGAITLASGEILRQVQAGRVNWYLCYLFAGTVFFLTFWLLV